MRALILSLAVLSLAFGCSRQAQTGGDDARMEVAQEESVAGYATAPADAAATTTERGRAGAPQAPPEPTPPPGAQVGTPSPAPVLYLAYSYNVGIELPADRLAGLMDAHVRACTQAGPRLCQLIGSLREGDPESSMSGTLSIRGEPQWLRTYMSRLQSDAEGAGGRIRSQATNTEDLTRAIVDTEASLRAMRTMRDRLQQMLANRPGRLADLLEVERELARVQTQIDATDSNLAVMRTRVAMSELSINYQSAPRAVASDTFEPLTDAFASFLGFVVGGVAAIVTLIAVILPWALVIGLAAWIALAIRRRRGGRFFRRAAPNEPPAQT